MWSLVCACLEPKVTYNRIITVVRYFKSLGFGTSSEISIDRDSQISRDISVSKVILCYQLAITSNLCKYHTYVLLFFDKTLKKTFNVLYLKLDEVDKKRTTVHGSTESQSNFPGEIQHQRKIYNK